MSGIAALLLELGHDVSGSDKVELARNRATCSGSVCDFSVSIARKTQRDAELIIFSSAIKKDNPILVSARATRQAGCSARRSAGGDHARQARHRHRGDAWEDDDFRDDGACFARRRLASVALCRRGNSDSRDRMRIGIRAANISSRKATKATARSRFFQPEHALVLNIEEEHLDFYADLAAIEAVFCSTARANHRHRFFIARMIRTRRESVRARPRVDFLRFRPRRGLSRHRSRSAGFRVGFLRFSPRREAWRSAS